LEYRNACERHAMLTTLEENVLELFAGVRDCGVPVDPI
jgi:hypothetical protein